MKIKFFTLTLMLSSFLANAQYTQVVDLSTGVVNGSTSLSAIGSNDDTWTVKPPGSSSFQNAIVSDGSLSGLGPIYYLPTGTCGRWVSPYTVTTSPNFGSMPVSPQVIGLFEYKSTFTKTACQVTSALMTFTLAGADNRLVGFSINGNYHDLMSENVSFSPLRTFSVTIPPGEFISGTNTILMFVRNTENFTGLYLCADLALHSDMAAALSGPSSFCSGFPIQFTGSTTGATATSYYWELTECSSSGVPTTGGFTWNNWYSGAPGIFTFPSNLSVPCGKYYRVKLAVATSCIPWVETTKIIYINCLPPVNAGPDKIICKGTCVDIGVAQSQILIDYQWTLSTTGLIGTTKTINVCPDYTSTYTHTATDVNTGCYSTDYITVTVLDNDPSFSHYANTSNASYFTLDATPNNTSAFSLPGFGYLWYVEEINGGGTQVFNINNPSAWWTFNPPLVITNSFNGFDHTAYSYSGNASLASNSTPANGKFLYNHRYKITRGTWSTACGYQQYTLDITSVKALNGGPVIIATVDDHAPDLSYLMTAVQNTEAMAPENIFVYPNPSNGIFSMEMNSSTKAGIEVYDALGKKVEAFEHSGFKSTIDLSGQPKGMYIVNILTDGKLTSKKIILE